MKAEHKHTLPHPHGKTVEHHHPGAVPHEEHIARFHHFIQTEFSNFERELPKTIEEAEIWGKEFGHHLRERWEGALPSIETVIRIITMVLIASVLSETASVAALAVGLAIMKGSHS